jgi:uncharacterized membrane protein YphA (DoxX/SURF4 family)
MTTMAKAQAVPAERTDDARVVLELLRVLTRPALSAGAILYGLLRLFSVHYPPGDPTVWIHRFGELPPSEFLSVWMGVSPVSESIASAAIILGGLLIALPQTTTLGALILLATMINEVMLRFGFGNGTPESHRAMTPA